MPLNHNRLTDILKKDSEINFIAFCTTPWHAISTCAALKKLQSGGEKLKGIILADKGDIGNPAPLIEKSVFSSLGGIDYKTDYFSGVEFPKGKIKNLKRRLKTFSVFMRRSKGGRKIFVLHPMSVNVIFAAEIKKNLPNAKVISVITDEGLGSYMRSDFNWAIEIKNVSGSSAAFFRALIDKPIGRFYKRVSAEREELLDCRLLKEKNSGFAENGEMTEFYKNAAENETLNPADYRRYEGAVIISAQLYYETGQIKNNADLALYSEIAAALKSEGKTVILKPHPRDKNLSRYEGLGCFVEKNNTAAQESIFNCLDKKPAAVIAFTSTGLITAKIFGGVRGISANRLLPAESVSNSLKNEFANFERAFSDMVFLPADIKSLVNSVKNTET